MYKSIEVKHKCCYSVHTDGNVDHDGIEWFIVIIKLKGPSEINNKYLK